MDPLIKVENDKLICLKSNHSEKVILFVTDDQVPFSDRFLCSKCTETHQNVYKQVMPINSAIAQIKEKIAKQNEYEQELREKSLNIIKLFSSQINEFHSTIAKQLNEIKRISEQWILELENLQKKDDLIHIIKEFEFFNSSSKNKIKENNKGYFIKLETIFKKLKDQLDYERCYSILNKTIQDEKIMNEINQQEHIQESVNQMIVISQIQSIKKHYTNVLAFNYKGNILVTGSKSNLKVWKFKNETLCELQTLPGHTNWVNCIVFSQQQNWFFSGSSDKTIKCWRKNKKQWICTSTVSKYTDEVGCLLMNRNENQLISCSLDKTIRVWKIDDHKLEYSYSLDKHANSVFSISLNESETALVSCSQDNTIILWVKDQKWKYQHHITNNDFGYRICFIDNNSIIWQQYGNGITHLFQIENGKLTQKPEFNIELNKENNDDWLFPTIYNKQKEIIIQKHNKYIYILQRQKDGKLLLICQPIEQSSSLNFGTLSNDGQYLATWSVGKNELRVFKLTYK